MRGTLKIVKTSSDGKVKEQISTVSDKIRELNKEVRLCDDIAERSKAVSYTHLNEAMRGTLKIVKTSSDGKVKGFAFRVTGANGYDMTFETDKNGDRKSVV